LPQASQHPIAPKRRSEGSNEHPGARGGRAGTKRKRKPITVMPL
jgi:hypothetical protein